MLVPYEILCTFVMKVSVLRAMPIPTLVYLKFAYW